jgi:hypothetical protein
MKPFSKRVPALLMVGAACVGAGVGGAALAGAATSTSTPTASSSTSTGSASTTAPTGTPPDPATIDHGPGETLLTGTTAEKVKAAALAAVPGGTILRVETDSGGAEYEAHMTKADGTPVTVKLDANFKVTATEDGNGSGPGARRPAPSGTAG